MPDSHLSGMLKFCEACERLTETRSKLKKRAAIADYLLSLPVVDAEIAVHFMMGRPFAETDPRSLSTGSAAISEAIRETTKASDSEMHAAYRHYGDLGSAAGELLAKLHPAESSLTLKAVYAEFERLSTVRTKVQRLALLKNLFGQAVPVEAKYLIKIMLGDMRTGVQQGLVEESIAQAWQQPIALVRQAVLFSGNLGMVARKASENALETMALSLFHPLGFMLASPAENSEEAVARMLGKENLADEECLPVRLHVEDKYDGIRAQVHCGDPAQPGRVAIYSRNRELITESFPELEAMFSGFQKPVILDGEILGWDETEKRASPFASLTYRIGRKRVTEEMMRTAPVAYMAFDCLYADGEVLLGRPLAERRKVLERVVEDESQRGSQATTPARVRSQGALFGPPESAGPIPLLISPLVEAGSVEDLEAAFLVARGRGNEGLMIKNPATAYVPGRRGFAWLKLKRELATLDVVVTGVEFGHGRRAAVLSDYTFAVGDGERLLNVGKAYSGLTDVEILTLTEWFKEHTLEDMGWFRTVEPTLVLEVAFNNVMRSARHNSGFALRFPRIVRLRPDKPVAEIDTLTRIAEIYESQPDKPREEAVTPSDSDSAAK